MFPFAVLNLSSNAKAVNGFSFQLFSFCLLRWYLANRYKIYYTYCMHQKSCSIIRSVCLFVCMFCIHCIFSIVRRFWTHYIYIKNRIGYCFHFMECWWALWANEINFNDAITHHTHNWYVWALSARHFQKNYIPLDLLSYLSVFLLTQAQRTNKQTNERMNKRMHKM